MKFEVIAKVTDREAWIAVVVEAIKPEQINLKEIHHHSIGEFQNGDRIIVAGTITEDRISYESFTRETQTESVGEWVEDYFVPRSAWRIFEHITRMMNNGTQALNLLIQGPSGYGKTSLAQAYAKANNLPSLVMSCGTIAEVQDWFGIFLAKKGTTVFVPSKFIEMVMAGNCVIILDEINRAIPSATNSLFSLLDDTRKLFLFDQEIAVGEHVTFFSTINLGYQYTGTFPLDTALRNRMLGTLDVGPLPPEVEIEVLIKKTAIEKDAALELVQIMNHLRSDEKLRGEVDFSTRSSLYIAQLLHVGMKLREALEMVLTRQLQTFHERELLITFFNRTCGIYHA